MAEKAFVLLSGGIDSTTCLYLAESEFKHVEALSIFYGQRHRKEIEYAARTAGRIGIKHSVLDLSSIVPQTALTDANAAIPNVAYKDIVGVSPAYVPFRNGLMLAAIASYVAGQRTLEPLGHPKEEWAIYWGAHAEDAAGWAYPDCTPEFAGAMAAALFTGTDFKIRLRTPLQWMLKDDIINLGEKLGVRWTDTWSCYRGELLHCGTCPTCRARKDGFRRASLPDPTEYAA